MSALDDARAVLEFTSSHALDGRDAARLRVALVALVAECEALETDRVAAFLAGSDFPPTRRHGDTGGRLLSDDEDPIPS